MTPRNCRLQELAIMAWQALITAQPTANPDAHAVRAIELAKSMLQVEEAIFGKVSDGQAQG